MEHEENDQTTQQENSTVVYVIGAMVIVALIVTGYMLWPKGKKSESPEQPKEAQKTETKTISGLSCETQWYNPMIGYPKYYISAKGTDLSDSAPIECTFTIKDGAKVIATASATATITIDTERNGVTYICTTKATELTKGSHILSTSVKNAQGKESMCKEGAMNLQ